MRFKLIIAYDGTDFLGWQSQADGNAVQDIIEKRLAVIFKQPVRLHGASRTDSGVHAKGQVAHFDADWKHGTTKLQKAIQCGLPHTVFIHNVKIVPESFHARFGSHYKRYTYTFKTAQPDPFETRTHWGYPFKFDGKTLRAALKLFIGKHDFTSFAASVNEGENTIKTLYRVSAKTKGKVTVITIEGSGFLYKMARRIVGTALEAARGKIPLSRIKQLIKKPEQTSDVVGAPAHGLCLEKIVYPKKRARKKSK